MSVRDELIRGIDSILDAPWWARKLVRAEDIRLLKALRSYCLDAPETVLSEIESRLAREPKTTAPEAQGEPSMWKVGPMPPDTWGFGAVKLAAHNRGEFVFADFKGDHAVVFPGEHRVEQSDVVWYNNSITEPPCDLGAGRK